MPENSKRCSRCRETKDRSEFGKQTATKDGLRTFCRVCAVTVNAYSRNRNTIRASLTPEEFAANIDFRAKPDGVGGFHYRWKGATGLAGRGRLTPLQRFSLEADGRMPPPRSKDPNDDTPYVWCEDETPWPCCNPDHIVWPDDLPGADIDEFTTYDGDGLAEYGMSVTEPVSGRSRAEALRFMESSFDPEDEAADKFLREHGFNAKGEPL